LRALNTYSTKLTNTYMVGSLRGYMSIIIGTMFIVTLLFMFLTGGLYIQTDNLASISVIEVIVSLVVVTSGIGIILSNHNVAAILILGILGYGVAILFVIDGALDLALTQLVIESVTVALFLLCFYDLTNLKKRSELIGKKIVNDFISIGYGLMMTLVGISAHS